MNEEGGMREGCRRQLDTSKERKWVSIIQAQAERDSVTAQQRGQFVMYEFCTLASTVIILQSVKQ